ncbi:MAG: tRNA1(Val) (adenine(37)-N6)-methyltransferase, partial [Clostridia bacterium]|nr:tRNA1(Val) (adenine(37)-N6)-methyltransferase [Clostridia bacterium]
MPDLKSGERIDDLQNGYKLIQKEGTFCFGTDTVLLADFAAPRKREKCVDMGTGNGAIAMLMAAHQPEISIDAVEIQPQMADMAYRSVQLNHLEDRIRVHTGDMRCAYEYLGYGKASLVVCNPPYGGSGAVLLSKNEPERIARHESDLSCEDVACAADKLLKFGGRLCVVFPAPRAYEMMAAMDKYHLAPKRIRSVHATAEKAPKIVLIEAVKGGGKGLHWMPPLILSDENGNR